MDRRRHEAQRSELVRPRDADFLFCVLYLPPYSRSLCRLRFAEYVGSLPLFWGKRLEEREHHEDVFPGARVPDLSIFASSSLLLAHPLLLESSSCRSLVGFRSRHDRQHQQGHPANAGPAERDGLAVESAASDEHELAGRVGVQGQSSHFRFLYPSYGLFAGSSSRAWWRGFGRSRRA